MDVFPCLYLSVIKQLTICTFNDIQMWPVRHLLPSIRKKEALEIEKRKYGTIVLKNKQ